MVYGLWNTTAGRNGSPVTASSGIAQYQSSEGPGKAFDQNSGTKYLLYGSCSAVANPDYCGINNGLHVSPQQGLTLLLAIQFTTGSDNPDRDPLSITIEGSNATSSALMLGTSWSLVYNGSTGLNVDPGRQNNSLSQCIPHNANWYLSYRLLVTSTRSVSSDVQYSEVKLFGYVNPNQGTSI